MEQAKSHQLITHIATIATTLYLEFSITTIDFFFLEDISDLATIGVASIMPYIYMLQNILTLISQSMITSNLYYCSNSSKYHIGIAWNLILTITISGLLILILLLSKDYLLLKVNINHQAKLFSQQYLTFIIPFFFFYGIQQYYSYLFYAHQKYVTNLVLITIILILNIILDFISINWLHYGIIGIAIASSLAIIITLPIYIIYAKRYKLYMMFKNFINYLPIVTHGIKNLGLASILEPISIQAIKFIIIIALSHIADEVIAAKQHAHNLLTFCLTIALAISIITQYSITFLYSKQAPIKRIKYTYYKMLSLVGIIILILASLVTLFIYFNNITLSANTSTNKYILIYLLFGSVILEPLRGVSIVAKSALKGLQRANLALFIKILIKIFLIIPIIYFASYSLQFGIYIIIFAEALGYLCYFLTYHLLYQKILYKNKYL